MNKLLNVKCINSCEYPVLFFAAYEWPILADSTAVS